ncbi:apoptosis inhibitory protein 5-domain-containing protein [Hygrophoropsis aurantiaca]|uniref:Apoptosis inhibitory protein 5-domain-containing protein n=1 Tax=Hygrophoropsis aurantiaca TaxID=72124 RepID=A0ACB8AGR1_9AGAM|nr:apoptosis inhibitory protein 5-domain-containing protein [Hygrophoropsis aurantiaca]
MNRIKELVRKAEKDSQRSGATRREAFKQLIELTHSENSSLKSYAANNIKSFFSDFPDLEEDAINAVYDLCEDQDSAVRVDGYKAIVEVSRAQTKWVKRNADVLVQLLQSDEPNEVDVVKTALCEHLDMDPGVTLGVLCDQVIPPEEPLDEEEKYIRDRLRSLVIAFLTGEARSAIVQKYTEPPGTEAENVMVGELLTAISRLDTSNVEVIVKDILLSLPCYHPGSSRGTELLDSILQKVRGPLRERATDAKTLQTVEFYLSLADFVSVERRVASPAELLRFYCTSLTGKLVLQRFPQQAQIALVSHIADALPACLDESRIRPHVCSPEQFYVLQKQVVDACPILFEVLWEPKSFTSKQWRIVQILLSACKDRKERDKWLIPSHLVSAIRKFQSEPLAEQSSKEPGDIQGLIRSLVGQAPQVSSATRQVDAPPHLSNKSRPSIRRPEMPSAAVKRENGLPSAPSPIGGRQPLAGNATPQKRNILGPNEEVSQHKRARMDSNSAPREITPSLLSRMAESTQNPRVNAELPQRPRTNNARSSRDNTPRGASPLPDHPVGGYSIKGAANVLRDAEDRPIASRSSSLLDRMINSSGDVSMTSVNDGGGVRGRRQRGDLVK